MGPIAPVSISPVVPVTQVYVPAGQASKAKSSADPYAGVAPFWRDASQRVAAAGSDHARFAMLAKMAQESGRLPPAGNWLPPQIDLKLHEDEVREWARDQYPGVRGRLYRLMLGINMATLWPYYTLQNEGRFDPQWQKAVSKAAERYIRALRTDPEVLALLRSRMDDLDRQQRRFLAERMVSHAAQALEISAPLVRLFDTPPDSHDQGKEAEAIYGTPVKIHFYPDAFRRGSVNLIVTVFHEAVHAQQMELIRAAQLEEDGLSAQLLDADASGRAAVLELSMMHLHEVNRQRAGDRRFYLYRYGTEAEREAHMAELAAAMLAAECPEFNPAPSGALHRIRASAEPGVPAHDPEALVMHHVRQETGLDAGRLAESAAGAETGSKACAPTLHALRALQQRRRPLAMSMRRAIERGDFVPAAHSLAGWGALPLPEAAAPAAAVPAPAALSRTPRSKAAGLWEGLLKLERLRDPLDTSDMLSHAVLSCAPKLFYGRSDEAQFLRSVIISALDAARPPLVQVVSRHLEQRFAFRFARAAADPAAVAGGLQRAWYTYTSALSRRILFEVAAEAMGAGRSGGPLTDARRAARISLRRAIVSGRGLPRI